MKTFVFAFFLFPFLASAQDTCGLKKETDPFTHLDKISTGFVPFTVEGIPLYISIDATKTDIDFFLWIKSDAKCFDDASSAQIIFDGGKLKANYKNTGSMNCEGAFHMTFRNLVNTPSNLMRLTDKRIASIKLTGNNKEITDINFSEAQKQQLMRMAVCLVREAKTLLK